MQATLYKGIKDEEEHYIVLKESHIRPSDREIKSLAQCPIPKHTVFSKLPWINDFADREQMIEALREQKDYWESQIASEIAQELNDADKLGGGGDIEKHDRYKQRVKACSIFLQALQDRPQLNDKRIFHGEEVDASDYITKSSDGTGRGGSS
ncbi:hypothetical protein ACM16X_02395 [Haloarcula japonica]|uniref:hypothetical protein n=1 Tax=Haloarcula japonica TaxID=29282 RepID=UPI0039F6EE59